MSKDNCNQLMKLTEWMAITKAKKDLVIALRGTYFQDTKAFYARLEELYRDFNEELKDYKNIIRSLN